MNNKIREQIAAFNKYARQLLEEQEVQLKTAKDDHLLSGKLARIKVFNEHLDILKNKLQNHRHTILTASAALPADQYTALEKTLRDVSLEYVNEYLCISFIKESD